jgi:hypothetical protein
MIHNLNHTGRCAVLPNDVAFASCRCATGRPRGQPFMCGLRRIGARITRPIADRDVANLCLCLCLSHYLKWPSVHWGKPQ